MRHFPLALHALNMSFACERLDDSHHSEEPPRHEHGWQGKSTPLCGSRFIGALVVVLPHLLVFQEPMHVVILSPAPITPRLPLTMQSKSPLIEKCCKMKQACVAACVANDRLLAGECNAQPCRHSHSPV